jgi:hypothetical protein
MFRFTIRDLLWLTLLMAVAVAWWVDRGRLASEVERLRPFAEWKSYPPLYVDPIAAPPISGDKNDP